MSKPFPLGRVLRTVRERHDLSARELSAQAGLSASYVTKLEAGELDPSLKTFGKIAGVLKLTPMEVYFCVVLSAMQADGQE